MNYVRQQPSPEDTHALKLDPPASTGLSALLSLLFNSRLAAGRKAVVFRFACLSWAGQFLFSRERKKNYLQYPSKNILELLANVFGSSLLSGFEIPQ